MASEPVDLNDLELDWLGGPQRRLVDGTEPEAQRLLPLRAAGRPFDRYSSAVPYLDRTYFELVDVDQAAAHELAAAHMRCGRKLSTDQLPFRSLIGNPFDLPRRAVQAALDVLTVRRDRRSGTASFFLHWRDPAKVAVGSGLYSAIPVGVFQPSSVAPEAQQQDFDLWRNLVREFSEELLGMPEQDGSSSALVDYERWPLFRRLTHACASRSLGVLCFGIGLDPLWLGTDILATVIIESEVFDEVFGDVVPVNAEKGQVVAREPQLTIAGIPFTQEYVQRFLTSTPMGPGGAACLALSWKHREALLNT